MSEADDDSMVPSFLCGEPPKRTDESSFLFALSGKKQPNRHQRLFWFGANGPAFILHVVRTTLFFVSVYFALLVFRFGDDLSGTTICLFGVALCFPLVIIWVLAPEVVSLLVLTTSIEMYKRWELVKKVNANEEQKRRNTRKKIMGTLRSQARLIRKKRGASPGASASPISQVDLPSDRVDELREAFGLFDSHGLDRVRHNDLVPLFKSVGIHLPQGEVADVLMEMDFNGDGDISFSEFCSYVANMNENRIPRGLLEDLFKFFDSDNHGSITVEQLREHLCSKNATISRKDVYDWVDPAHERSAKSFPLSFDDFAAIVDTM